MGDGFLERNYRDDDLTAALYFGGAFALLAAHGVAMIADDSPTSQRLMERVKQWSSR
jgi:hypothetical protein